MMNQARICFILSVAFLPPAKPALAADTADRQVESAVKRLKAAARIYDEREMRRASLALAEIGKPAVGALIQAMDDFDDNVRWQAIVALQRIGAAESAIPKLVESLADVDPDVRGAAAVALAKLHADDPSVVPALRQRLVDKHARVRADANWALWHLTAYEMAIPALVELLGHKDWMVRDAAVCHLAQIGGDAVPLLIAIVKRRKATGRAAAVRTLGLIGPRRNGTIAAVVAALDDSDAAVVQSAIKATGRLGPNVVRELLELFEKSHVKDRVAIVKAMGQIRWAEEAKIARCAVATTLKNILGRPPRDGSRLKRELLVAATEAIGQLGATGQVAVPELRNGLKNLSPDIRAATAATLGRIQTTSKTVKSELQRLAADDPTDFVRASATDALRRMAKDSLVRMRSLGTDLGAVPFHANGFGSRIE